MKLEVTIPFEINGNTVKAGETIEVKDKGLFHYYITKLNDKALYSIWMRKPYILAHCTKLS